MWTALKRLFNGKKEAKKAPRIDLTAVMMLQQIVKAHLRGKTLYPDGGLKEQADKIMKRAENLGVSGNSVVNINTEIKKILADNALGKVR
tara:strand:- start:151 stop:420 length:270 start_codon:yes stop_codon:yes gene_type:complete